MTVEEIVKTIWDMCEVSLLGALCEALQEIRDQAVRERPEIVPGVDAVIRALTPHP